MGLARARYKSARQAEMNAIGALREAEYRFQRCRDARVEATGAVEAAHYKEERSKRELNRARVALQEARQRGRRVERLEADLRLREADGRQAGLDFKRWKDEAARAESEFQELSRRVDQRKTELHNRRQEVARWKSALDALGQRPDQNSDGKPAPGHAGPSLVVTDRAVESLKLLLETKDHRPDQAFRLLVDDAGKVKLEVDSASPTDQVVVYRGRPVLIVNQPLPDSVIGSKLDVTSTPDGPVFYLAR